MITWTGIFRQTIAIKVKQTLLSTSTWLRRSGFILQRSRDYTWQTAASPQWNTVNQQTLLDSQLAGHHSGSHHADDGDYHAGDGMSGYQLLFLPDEISTATS